MSLDFGASTGAIDASFDDYHPADDPNPLVQARPVALYTSPAFSAPQPGPTPSPAPPIMTPHRASSTPIRSVLKSTSATPLSGLRDPSQMRTPANKYRHRRSVSFSDGKLDGPIQGLRDREEEESTEDGEVGPDEAAYVNHEDDGAGEPSFAPSARSKRIAALMEELEDTSETVIQPEKIVYSP